MKKNNFWKRFWSLNVHNHEGFTLVELIIVIAILAILSGVAVVGYSSYVEKANKQADMTLAAEVANALTLYYYDNGGITGGYVILSIEGDVRGDTNGDAAMKAAYGDNWKNQLKLKYAGWTADASDNAYIGSSFHGNEGSLLNQIGNLTDTMKDVLADHPELAGSQFNDFLAELAAQGVDIEDEQAVANAAVLYVASIAQTVEADKVTAAFDTFYADRMSSADDTPLLALIEDLSKDAGLGDLGACSAIYAQAEAFCQYIDANAFESDLLQKFHEKTNGLEATDDQGQASTGAALRNVAEVFDFVVQEAMTKYSGIAYAYVFEDEQAARDAEAFLDAMGIVTEHEEFLSDRLGMEDCFTDGTVENMLVNYVGAKDGEIMILIDADGKITISPKAAKGE